MKKHQWYIFAIVLYSFPIFAFAQRDVFYETKLLAEWGKTTSQYELGLMYYHGRGVEQNYNEAFKWFRVSAKKGLPDALYYFGLMHYEGTAVAQNYSNAFYLFLEAAKEGQAQAKSMLGDRYISGKGVRQNYIKAYVWTSLALKNGYEMAKRNLQFLNKKLTASELETAMAEAAKMEKSFNK
jgi:TPR repeat protein